MRTVLQNGLNSIYYNGDVCMSNKISGSACEVLIDPSKRMVCKRVYYTNQGIENGHDKLWYEIEYLIRMNKANDFFPKVLSYYYKKDFLNLELEYLYEGESLADVILAEEVSEDYIEKSLILILKQLFGKFYIKQDIVPNPRYWQECYLERTKRRIDISLHLLKDVFPKWKTLKKCIENGIEVNGISYSCINKYISYLQNDSDVFEKLKISGTFCSHHDLIPENIMIKKGDDSISEFKMIDPRGDSETGKENRHFIYDMGKMLFGLDCYGLFRRGYHLGEFQDFNFTQISDCGFLLSFNSESKSVKHLIIAQNIFMREFEKIYEKSEECNGDGRLQLLFSFACMYIPDVPCRMIDEKNEELSLIFYARGCMIMHKLFIYLYGKDSLSSDYSGEQFEMWPMKNTMGGGKKYGERK